jgi:hypothetical protein
MYLLCELARVIKVGRYRYIRTRNRECAINTFSCGVPDVGSRSF